MISQKTVALYGWITLGILVLLLILVWTGSISPEMRLAVLVVAGVLVVSRVILRVLSARGNAGKSGNEE